MLNSVRVAAGRAAIPSRGKLWSCRGQTLYSVAVNRTTTTATARVGTWPKATFCTSVKLLENQRKPTSPGRDNTSTSTSTSSSPYPASSKLEPTGSPLMPPQEPPPLAPPRAQIPALHEDIYNLPNILTFSRLVAAPVVGYLILHDSHAWAVGLLAYAGVTDLLDGWIARRWDKKTVVGTVIDPMADKALMTILTVCLAVKGALPVWLAFIILGRDAGLGIAAIYYRWISLPPPKTFSRYWDFSLPSAEVHPTTISKYNTLLQLGLVGLTTAAPLVTAWDLSTTLGVMQYVVAATTVWSGASYMYSKDAVKILNQKKPSAKGKE